MSKTAAAVAAAPEEHTVEQVLLDRLNFDPQNARVHPDDNMAAIKGSLTRFGQTQALLVQRSTGMVIAGNGRLAAMRELGWESCSVSYRDWSDAEARAYSVVDNRTGELAIWDLERLETQVEAMRPEFDLDGLGFDESALDDLFGEDRGDADDVDQDDVPDVPATPTTKLGDVWQLGPHLLLCGDSTDEAQVARVIDAGSADAVLTDPPYGVDYVGKNSKAMTIHNDGRETLRPLLAASLALAKRATRPGAVWYVAAPSGPQFLDFAVVLTDLEIWRQTIAWVKDGFVLGHSDYHYRHESIFYGWTPKGEHVKPTDRKQDSVWEIERPRASQEHPTMKPIELYARMLQHSSREGDLVYEPFGGSGTTLIACEQMKRRCVAVELSPGYCDVICQRFENLTGHKAVLRKERK